MKIIAANGILVLLPSALFLGWKAANGAFDTPFAIIQIIELVAGALNITLLTANMRSGLTLRANKRHQRAG